MPNFKPGELEALQREQQDMLDRVLVDAGRSWEAYDAIVTTDRDEPVRLAAAASFAYAQANSHILFLRWDFSADVDTAWLALQLPAGYVAGSRVAVPCQVSTLAGERVPIVADVARGGRAVQLSVLPELATLPAPALRGHVRIRGEICIPV